MQPNYKRSHLHMLMDCLDMYDSVDIPEDIKDRIHELIELCSDYIGKGYTYRVIKDDDGNIDLQEIDIL